VRIRCLVLRVISCAALMCGTAFASPSNQDSRPDKNDSHRHIGATSVTKRPPGERRLKPVPSQQVRSRKKLANNPKTRVPADAVHFHQAGSSGSTGVPNKLVSNRSVPVHLPRVAALSGQQVMNAHNRASSRAMIGGIANATKSTAVINGTGMNRRH